jgi:multiple sugar transport system substrate-binding protein
MAKASAVTRRAWASLTGASGASAALGLAALTACAAPGQGGEGGAAGQAGLAGPATIRVMHRGSNQAQLDELEAAVALFNDRFAARQWKAVAEYHNSQSGSYDEKLVSLLVGGTLPDSFYMNGENLPILASRGGYYDLSAIAARDKATQDYYPELLELSRYKGKLHGLPKDYSPHVIWINETALQQAGVALPRPDWTWDDLLDTARRFTQRGADGKTQRLGLFNLSGSWYIPVWQNGGELFDKEITRSLLDQPAALEALQWVGDVHSRHKVAGLTTDLNALGAQNIAQAIQQGGVALWWMGRWGLPDLRKLSAVKYEAYPLPRGKKEANVFLQSGPTAGAGTKHPEVVWEFLKSWTGPEGQTINIESGVSIPTVKDKATLEKYLAKAPPSRQSNQVFLDAMKVGRVQPVTPNIGWGDWGAVWNAERDKLIGGEATARQFADVVVPRLNALIKEKAQA